MRGNFWYIVEGESAIHKMTLAGLPSSVTVKRNRTLSSGRNDVLADMYITMVGEGSPVLAVYPRHHKDFLGHLQ